MNSLNPRPLSTAYHTEFRLITSSERKLAEFNTAFSGRANFSIVRGPELPEMQATDHMLELLKRKDSTLYAEIARESALQKFNAALGLYGREIGNTIADSTFFSYSWGGFPHINAKSFFEHPESYDALCDIAKRSYEPRAQFIETLVTLEVNPTTQELEPVVRQGIAEGYIPEVPRGDGWAFDKVFCPDPVRLARFTNRNSEADELSRIRDLRERAARANEMGLLVTFAEKPELKLIHSPRALVAKQFTA